MFGLDSPVGWGCRIHLLHLCKYRRYDTKPSDGDDPALEFVGIWSTSSLPLLRGPLWSGVVSPDRALSMGQIELFDI